MEFYDPMLYLSTPEHPNMMGVIVGLKEDIDGDILQEVVEGLRVRFPRSEEHTSELQSRI